MKEEEIEQGDYYGPPTANLISHFRILSDLTKPNHPADESQTRYQPNSSTKIFSTNGLKMVERGPSTAS